MSVPKICKQRNNENCATKFMNIQNTISFLNMYQSKFSFWVVYKKDKKYLQKLCP
jgi:hypothetical protein